MKWQILAQGISIEKYHEDIFYLVIKDFTSLISLDIKHDPLKKVQFNLVSYNITAQKFR